MHVNGNATCEEAGQREGETGAEPPLTLGRAQDGLVRRGLFLFLAWMGEHF